MNPFDLKLRPAPVPIGQGIVDACPHCWTSVEIEVAQDDPDGFSLCPECGEIFIHQPDPHGRLCARFSRSWFLSVTGEDHRRNMRELQEGVWQRLGQFG